MDEVAVDGVSIGLTGRTAILDTVSYNLCPLLPQQTLTRSLLQGTTLLIAPAPDAEAIHAAIPGAKSDGQGGESALLYCLSTLFLRFSEADTLDSFQASLSLVRRTRLYP